MRRKVPGAMNDRETGAILEAIKNFKEDQERDRLESKDSRLEQKTATEKLSERVDELRMAVNGQTQTVQSLGNRLYALDAEKCDERLKALEEFSGTLKDERVVQNLASVRHDVERHNTMLGTWTGFLVRVGAALIVAAALAFASKFISFHT